MKPKSTSFLKLFTSVLLFSILFSCKKETNLVQINDVIKAPEIKYNSAAPNGVLYFANKESLINVISRLREGKELEISLPSSFSSLKKYFDEHNSKINQITNTSIRASSYEGGGRDDFFYSQYENLVPDDNLPSVLNNQLQIMVGEVLYQITRIGTFIIEPSAINTFTAWYNNNQNSIWLDPQYQSVPGEVYLGDNLYQISYGIVRAELNIEDITQFTPTQSGPALLTPDNAVPQSYGPNIPMDTYTVGSNFKQNDGKIYFDDRRFLFKAYNLNYIFFRSIGIEGKLQRKKKFLFISYWGESFADEIIVGGENMDLKTDYVAPTPEIMSHNLMSQPTFNGLINFKFGNLTTNLFHLDVNAYILGRTINNSDVNRWANGGINSLANNVFNSAMVAITNGLANFIDPTYRDRLKDNGMILKSYQDNSRLRFTLANISKYEGYSHKNDWNFDWNVKFGTSGETAYGYEMLEGSFYGKARVGNNWYGIRIVKI